MKNSKEKLTQMGPSTDDSNSPSHHPLLPPPSINAIRPLPWFEKDSSTLPTIAANASKPTNGATVFHTEDSPESIATQSWWRLSTGLRYDATQIRASNTHLTTARIYDLHSFWTLLPRLQPLERRRLDGWMSECPFIRWRFSFIRSVNCGLRYTT